MGGWLLKSAATGNLLFQISFFISFLPTTNGVWKNSIFERANAWILFAAAYFFGILIVLFRWQGQIQEIVFPLNAFFLHSVIGDIEFAKNSSLADEFYGVVKLIGSSESLTRTN